MSEDIEETLEDPDWCKECNCPIGLGVCDGCFAVSCSQDFDPRPEDHCRHCGKEFEDFSDMGCEYCDQRNPGFGVLP